jgi:hypothetical protein
MNYCVCTFSLGLFNALYRLTRDEQKFGNEVLDEAGCSPGV